VKIPTQFSNLQAAATEVSTKVLVYSDITKAYIWILFGTGYLDRAFCGVPQAH